MTSKTKYIVIVLFTLILASVSVGLSTWNVHYQAEIGTIGYEKIDPVTQESLLNRYVYFEPVKDAGGNITNPTKQDYPISGSLNESIFTYVYDGNTHTPNVFTPTESIAKGTPDYPESLFMNDEPLDVNWGIAQSGGVFDDVIFNRQYRLIAMPYVSEHKGKSDNYCEITSIAYGEDTIDITLNWKNGNNGNHQAEGFIVHFVKENGVFVPYLLQNDRYVAYENVQSSKIKQAAFNSVTGALTVQVNGFSPFTVTASNKGWVSAAPSDAGVYQCRITAEYDEESVTDSAAHEAAARTAVSHLNALSDSGTAYAAQVNFAIVAKDTEMADLENDSFTYQKSASTLKAARRTNATDTTAPLNAGEDVAAESGLHTINDNVNSFYVTYGGVGFEILIESTFTDINGGTVDVQFSTELLTNAKNLKALVENWEEDHYYTTYGVSPDPNYHITNPVVHYTVLRREIKIDAWDTNTFVYNGKAQSPVVSAYTDRYGAEFTYTWANASGTAIAKPTDTNEKSDTASYQVRASVGPNYFIACADGAGTLYDDGETAYVSYDYTITPKPVHLSWGETTLTYNGTNQLPAVTVVSTDIESGDTVNATIACTTTPHKDVGTYQTTSATLDNANYVIASGEATAKSFEIEPKPVEITWVQDTLTLTYNKTAQAPTATVKAGDLCGTDTCDVTVDGAKINVGNDYIATATGLTNDNYALADGTWTTRFNIEPKGVTVVWSEDVLTYNKAAQAPAASVKTGDLCDGDTCTVTVEGQQVNAGTGYTATATGLSNVNYKITAGSTTTFNIEKREVTLNWSATTFVYNGEEQAPTLTLGNLCDGDSVTASVTVDRTHKDVGNYTATATNISSTNYKLPASPYKYFNITPKEITLDWANLEFTYDKTAHKPTATVKNGDLCGTDTCIVSVSGEQTSAGTGYTATADLSNGNYTAKNGTQSFTIKPKEITLSWANLEFTYDGDEHLPTATAGGLLGGDTCTVTVIVVGEHRAAGTYTAQASALDNTNYKLPTANTQEYDITPKPVEITWAGLTLTYDGTAQAPTATPNGIIDGDDCDVSVSGAQTNAGTYTATATGLTNDNYTIKAGNWTTTTFTIKQKGVTVAWSTESLTYNGNPQAPTATLNGVIDGDTCTVTVEGQKVNAGTGYTATATLTGTHKANYTITSGATKTFDINRAPNTVTITSTSGWTFGSKPATESGVVQASALFGAVNITYYTDQDCTSEIAFAEIVNAGTYYVKVTSTGDGTNYDGDAKTASFTVAKAKNVITFTPGYPAGWTYGDKHETEADVVQATAQFGGTITFKYYTDEACTAEIAFGDIVNAGTYYVVATSSETDNYSETSETSQFVVERATLTVTADSVTVIYGDPVPTFTYTCEGFVNGDNESVLTGSLTSDYTQGKNANTRWDILIGTLSADNYEISYNGTYFTVKQREISLNSALLEYSYGETNATAIIANAKSNVNGIYNSDNVVSISYTTDASNYISTATISVGNTYLIEYEINNSNYVWKEGSSTSCYYKYKTANIGGMYYTIEDAIKTGGHIILAGGSSYVTTSFTALSGYYSADCYTLKVGNSIFVPHKANATYSGLNEQGKLFDLGESGTVYSVLTIPSNVSLTVKGALGLGGYIKSGGAISGRGVVMNEGTITIDGSLHAIGFLKSATGKGKVVVNNNALLLDIFTIHDYKGGRNTLGIKEVFPFNAYSLHNVSCETIIYPSATYNAKFYLSVSSPVGDVVKELTVVGASGIFTLSDGLIKKSATNPRDTSKWTTDKINALISVTGSNQLAGQKDIITICGRVTDNRVRIKETVLGMGIDIYTGPDYPLPVSYMDIMVGDEQYAGELILDDVSYNFLPGTKLTVSPKGTLTVDSDIELYFYTREQCTADFITDFTYTQNGTAYPHYIFNDYCVDFVNATLEVNGTATINGYIGGTITTTENTGTIKIVNPSASVKYLKTLAFSDSSLTGSSAGYNTTARNATGMFVNNALGTSYISGNFSAGTYYSAGTAWYNGNYTLTYDYNDGATTETTTKAKGTALSSADISKLPARTGYTFGGWYLEAACTTPANTTTKYYGNVTLYAKWTANTYTVFFNATGGTVYKPSKTVTYDSPYGDTTEALPIPLREGYTFNGWWTGLNGTGDLISQDTIVKITSAQTLYAHWQANEYDVTFNYNFGDNPTVATYKITYNTTYSTVMPDVEVPDGYEFLGWWTAAEGGTQVNASDVYTLTTGQTLYAHWNELADYVLVTYLDNSGNQLATGVKTGLGTAYNYNYLVPGYVVSWLDESGNAAVPLDSTVGSTVTVTATLTPITYTVVYDTLGGSTVESHTVNYGDSFTLQASTKAGYTLTWIVNNESKAVGSTVSNLTTTANATVTIRADWTAITYTVIYNANAGVGTMSSQQFTYDLSKELTANTFTRTGYKFKGWSTTADGDVVYNDEETVNNLTTTANATITLYAVWEANTYNITFHYYDNETVTLSGTFGSAYSLLITPTEPSGYTFAGWFADEAYTTAVTTITIANNHDVYAKYTRTITLIGNGGNLSPSTFTHVYGTTSTISGVTAERDNYRHTGFFTEPSGGNKCDTITNSTPNVIYAQWIEQYTVTYNYNSGSGSPASAKVDKGSTVTLPTPTRSGYTFNGWFTAASGGTEVGDAGASYSPTGNITLYAQWSRNNICIAAGTLITMADGTTKKVEDIQIGDSILMFNHETGKFEAGTVFMNSHNDLEWTTYEIINLEFDDGTKLRIINEHVLFDYTLMQYVPINLETMYQYVGHDMATAQFAMGEYVVGTKKLVKAYLTKEYTGIYNPVTYFHFNCIADGLLTNPGGTMPMWNIFEYASGLGYDQEQMQQDIEMYGLYTYEDFAEYLTPEIFDAVPIKYLKVAVGKGLLTEEEVMAFIKFGLGELADNENSITPTDNGASNIPVADTVVDALPPSTASGDKDGLDSD